MTKKGGIDVVSDFNTKTDKLDLQQIGIKSFDDLRISSDGNGVLITVKGSGAGFHLDAIAKYSVEKDWFVL